MCIYIHKVKVIILNTMHNLSSYTNKHEVLPSKAS